MINEVNTNNSLDNQLKWELLKYEIRRFQYPIASNALKKMKQKESTLKIY